jgi:uncharacterized protein (TIGR00299 family) protein
MGAAGDMLMAALLELHPGPADFLRRLNNIGIPDVVVSAEPSVKCGIRGTHVKVTVGGQEEGSLSEHGHSYEHSHSREHSHSHDHNRRSHEHNEHERSHDHNQHVHSHDHEHSHAHNHSNEQKHSHDHNHNSFHDIEHLIGHLRVSGAVKENALAVYNLVAEAESHVHGVPVNQIHFHEVGEMDALADIVGVCMLIEELAPEQIAATPVNVGSGFVHCAHGILPVPAPATARILQGVPIYSDNIVSGELCTPTGAALLKYFAKDFRKMPAITVSKIGYGMGKKDFEKANCVRAFIGGADGALHEEVVELICNLDDMTPEAVAFAQQLLLGEGALDVYTAPIGMKKGRAGLSFTCMCRTEDKDKMLFLIFKHTTTLGIREYTSRRYALKKEHTEVETEYGKVRVKTSRGFGITKTKPEYEDIAKIAKNEDMSVREVLNILNGITC